MLEAISLRLRADVPVGVYLSGGIDSSVIAGMVVHLVKEQGARMGNDKETDRITCFSIAFDEDSGFDESGMRSLFNTAVVDMLIRVSSHCEPYRRAS